MAYASDGSIRFSKPGGYIMNMILFLLAVGAVLYYLSPYSPQPTNLLIDAFNANKALNGLILGVLAVGIIYNLRQAGRIAPAVRWIGEVRRQGKPHRVPALLSAFSASISSLSRDEKLSAAATRSILDSVDARIEESREMGRYIGNLLVFLGLLGTFWGLLETVNAVADTISSLASTNGPAEDAVAQLIANLKEPLGGMGTAFSSSLFGLGGSLIVGFLDLQSGQAQNRFYNDLEDFLASYTATGSGSGGNGNKAMLDGDADPAAADEVIGAIRSLEAALADNAETQIKANAGQSAELRDEIRALNRTLIRVGGGE